MSYFDMVEGKPVKDGTYLIRSLSKDGHVGYDVKFVLAGSNVFVVPEDCTHYCSIDQVEESLK